MKTYKEYVTVINEASTFEKSVAKALKKDMNPLDTYDSWDDFLNDLSLVLEPNEKKQKAMVKKLEKLDDESEIFQNFVGDFTS